MCSSATGRYERERPLSLMVDVLIACVPCLLGPSLPTLQLSLVRGSVNRNDVDRRQPWRKLPLVVPDRSIRSAEDSKHVLGGYVLFGVRKTYKLTPFSRDARHTKSTDGQQYWHERHVTEGEMDGACAACVSGRVGRQGEVFSGQPLFGGLGG